MKKKTTILLAVLAFLCALGLTLYPLIAAKYNEAHQSAIHADYREIVAQKDDAEKEEVLEAARQYNAALQPGVWEDDSQDLLLWASEDYVNQLNLAGNGIMCYVRIPKIQVELPVFHGTDNATLEKGVGHLLGSSLPVGGPGTHAVLTGHSGMASQKMFSDLVDLKVGDIFYLEVMGETLAYQVDQIKVVLPYDTSLLEIIPSEDLCTLVTCTPYGVNTHRLLVRGSRISFEKPTEEETVPTVTEAVRSTWEQQYVKGLGIGILVMTVLGILSWSAWLIWRRWHG